MLLWQKANAIGDIASSVGGIADSAFGNPFAKTAPSGGGGGGGGGGSFNPTWNGPAPLIPTNQLNLNSFNNPPQ